MIISFLFACFYCNYLLLNFNDSRERVVNSTRGTLEEVSLQGLIPGTRYIIRVVAQNENGAGESSHEVEVVTQAEVDVPGPPQKVVARATSSFSILINWSPPIDNNFNVDRYKLYYRQVRYLVIG